MAIVYRNRKGIAPRPPETQKKYRNKPQTVDGIEFASKKEALRYETLIIMQKVGLISNLKTHPSFKITVNGKFICNYVADFSYTQRETEALHVEDTKGFKTAVYKLKKRLVKACHGIEVEEP